MSAAPSFIALPRNPAVSFANADGTAFKTVMSAGATLGSRIDALIGANTDTTAGYVVQLAIQKSTVDYVIGEVTIPIGSGTNNSAKSASLLNSVDIPALSCTENGALYLEAGCSLRARVKNTVAGVQSVTLIGIAGDY